MASSGAPSLPRAAVEKKPVNGFMSRFTNLLRPIHSASSISSNNSIIPEANGVSEKDFGNTAADTTPDNRMLVSSEGHNNRSRHDEDLAENKDRRRHARTLPPWVHSYERADLNHDPEQTSHLLPQNLQTAVRPQHNHVPTPKANAVRGRAFDHVRSAEAVTPASVGLERQSKWQVFAASSAYGYPQGQEGYLVDEQWVRENVPDLNEPWSPGNLYPEVEKDQRLWLFSPEKRTATGERVQTFLMRNPFFPLLIRLFVLSMTTTALGLGAWIFHNSNVLNNNPIIVENIDNGSSTSICQQQPSTYMAFIVDSAAIIYLVWITWDEYFSKPLGLRSSKDKMRLLFLDLLFIAFSAANLSLAFNTLTDQQWSCYQSSTSNNNNTEAAVTTCIYNVAQCHRQQALCGVLLIAVVAWVMAFMISTLRVVEHLSR